MSLFRTFEYWSWSQLTTYRKCPHWARLRYLERLPEPEPDRSKGEPANERGSRLHGSGEKFITDGAPLCKELTSLEGLYHDVRDLHLSGRATVQAEQKFYLDKNWRPCSKDDRWVMYVPDIKITGPINLTVDLKSGKKYGNEVSHYGQVEFYCVGAWIEDPGYDMYEGELWYADVKDTTPHSFTPEHLERARARLDTEATIMMNDKIHQPRPNKHTCRWCPYSPRGTGACPVGV